MLIQSRSAAEPAQEREPRPALLLQIAVVASYAGIAFLRPGLSANLAFVDPILAAVSFVAILSMARIGSPATRTGAKALLWIWLICVGSFLGLAGVGITGWAMSDMFRTLFAIVTFFAFWHLVYVTKMERYAIWGTAIGLSITTVALLVKPFTYRGQAYFEHPNYAGHYAVMAGFVLIFAGKSWTFRILGLVGVGMAIWQTGSFGAIAMALAMVAVLVFRSLTRNTAVLAIGLIALAIGALFLLSPASDNTSLGASWSVNGSISQERLDKSQGSRFEIWGNALNAFSKSPLGVGPDGIHARQIAIVNGVPLEIHNDALGYLVERGVLGLVGFIGLWVVLWRAARPGGLARMLIVGALVQGLFRETMHYRHMWLFIALALVVDAVPQRTRDEQAESAADVGAADPARPLPA